MWNCRVRMFCSFSQLIDLPSLGPSWKGPGLDPTLIYTGRNSTRNSTVTENWI